MKRAFVTQMVYYDPHPLGHGLIIGVASTPERADEIGKRYNRDAPKWNSHVSEVFIDATTELSYAIKPVKPVNVSPGERIICASGCFNKYYRNVFVGLFSTPEKAQEIMAEMFPSWELMVNEMIVDEVHPDFA